MYAAKTFFQMSRASLVEDMRIGKESHGQTSPIRNEFRERAIRVVAETDGESMRRIATLLGISCETLRKWVRQAEIDGGLRPGITTGSAAGPDDPGAGAPALDVPWRGAMRSRFSSGMPKSCESEKVAISTG